MTTKQIANSLLAPDGSEYVCLTDGNGNLVTAGGGSSGITIGTTPITGGATTQVLYNSAGTVGSSANFTFNTTGNILALGGVNFLFKVGTNNIYGGGAGNTGSTGVESTGFGNLALNTVDTGGANTAFGTSALQVVTSGTENTGLGTHAGKLITTGNNNTAVGTDTLFTLVTGSDNTAVGGHALFASTGSGNDAFGSTTLQNVTTGQSNAAFGAASGGAQTTGSNNVSVGYHSLATEATGSGNVAVGVDAGITQNGASQNTYLGYLSGFALTTGNNNVLIGASPDTVSYSQVTTGSANVALGYDVAVQTATASNQLVISNFIYGTGMSGTGASVSPGALSFGTKTQISGYQGTFSGALGSLQSIGITSTDGLGLINTTAATNVLNQWSPRIHWQGSGWGTTAPAAQTVDWIEELQTSNGTSAPGGNLVYSSQTNGAGYTPSFTLTPSKQIFTGSTAGTGFFGLQNSGAPYTGYSVSGVTASIYGQGAVCAQVSATGFFQEFGYIQLANNTYLTSPGNANWQFGNANAAAPVAQTLSFQGARGGTDSNVAAVNTTVIGSLGTGTGVVSTLIFQSGKAAASGTTQHTAVTGLVINAGTAVLTSYIVANLPAAATAGAGATAFVTDASTTLVLGLGGPVTGGGANKVPVYSDGTNWNYG